LQNGAVFVSFTPNNSGCDGQISIYNTVYYCLTLICSCSKSETPVLIATVEVTGITDVSALSGGIIVYRRRSRLQDKGVVWSTSG
jgi:hypothetical protein